MAAKKIQRPENLPAEPDAAPITLSVGVPISKSELDALLAKAETDCDGVAAIVVTDDSEYELADAMLSEIVTTKDAIVAIRKAGTGPVYAQIKEVEAWFRPALQAYERAERALKTTIGAYRAQRAQLEADARRLALEAAKTGDAETLTGALTLASEAGAPPEGNATVALRWVVDRVAKDLLPPEYWSPDPEKIQAEAERQGTRGDGDAPVIPGVIFKLAASVGARRARGA